MSNRENWPAQWHRQYPIPIIEREREAALLIAEAEREPEWNRYRKVTSAKVETCSVCGNPIEPRQPHYWDNDKRQPLHLHCRPRIGV